MNDPRMPMLMATAINAVKDMQPMKPVVLEAANGDEQAALAAINKAVEFLDVYYELRDHGARL